MSGAEAQPSGPGADGRFELAMAASGNERRNRPTLLVVLSVIAVVAAMGGAVWGMNARAKARADLVRALSAQARTERMAQEWGQLETQEKESPDANIGRPIPDLLSQMEGLATRAGIKDKPKPPRQSPQTRNGITVTEYYYSEVKDPSLKALLEWLRLAGTQIPGMEVYGLDLRPDPTNWYMNVTFRRWERPS